MNGAHRRKRRRRGSGRAQVQDGAPVRIASIPAMRGCRDDVACNWHGICSGCGEVIHLAAMEMSPGFGPYGVEELARLVVGDPPRCVECRRGAP